MKKISSKQLEELVQWRVLNNAFVKETAKENDQRYLVIALDEIMSALEKSLSLLQLNFNASSAIELYFLKSLRIWSKATKNYH